MAGGGGRECGGRGAVEAEAEAEAVADELIDARDRAAGVRARVGAEYQEFGFSGFLEFEGAAIGGLAGEVDRVVRIRETDLGALEDEFGGGLAVELGADHLPAAGEGRHGG
mgnify:FL=1